MGGELLWLIPWSNAPLVRRYPVRFRVRVSRGTVEVTSGLSRSIKVNRCVGTCLFKITAYLANYQLIIFQTIEGVTNAILS